MKLSISILSLMLAMPVFAAPAKSAKKKTDSAASTKKAEPTPAPTPKDDVAAADTTAKADVTKPEVKIGPIVRGPNKPKTVIATKPLVGEVFVAPSVASLGELWADAMTDDQIGAEADRKTWNPAFTFGAVQPIGGLAFEFEGSGTQFSAPVPGGRTQGFVAHGAMRVGYEHGRYGGEVGALVRVAQVETPETKSNGTPQVFPSVELRARAASGVVAFVSAWDNPVLPYGDEGWLRAGARHDWGRLSGELAAGIDPILANEDSTGPVIDSRLEAKVGRGYQVGIAMRAADEPMAALVVRRVW